MELPTLVTDPEAAAAWFRPRLRDWSDRTGPGIVVDAVVPAGYEAYARILHPVGARPAAGSDPGDPGRPWAEVAATYRVQPLDPMHWGGDTVNPPLPREERTES